MLADDLAAGGQHDDLLVVGQHGDLVADRGGVDGVVAGVDADVVVPAQPGRKPATRWARAG